MTQLKAAAAAEKWVAAKALVASAPAYFEIRCMDARCNGRHDLSAPILRALRQSLTSFAGESSCNGMVGDLACDRTLAYACEATYSTSA